MAKFYWTGDDWVDAAMFKPAPRKGPMIITDSHEPFKSMADGKIYDSKAAYRRSLREHGMVELGNELPKQKTFEPTNVGRDIKDALEQVRAGKGARGTDRAKLEQSISTGKTAV